MNRPDNVWIGAMPFTVIYDKAILDGHNGRERQDRTGRMSPRDLEIVIDDTMAEQVIRETLLHECMHAIWTDSGLGEMENLSEEQIINTLTPRLVSMMRVNPELMGYMLHETEDDDEDVALKGADVPASMKNVDGVTWGLDDDDEYTEVVVVPHVEADE